MKSLYHKNTELRDKYKKGKSLINGKHLFVHSLETGLAELLSCFISSLTRFYKSDNVHILYS